MARKLYLGNGVYISMYSRGNNKKSSKIRYKIVLEFFDITGCIAKEEIYYCDTYIDAYYTYLELSDHYFINP